MVSPSFVNGILLVGFTESSTLETFETENILIQWVVSPHCLGFTHPTLETNFKKKKVELHLSFWGNQSSTVEHS